MASDSVALALSFAAVVASCAAASASTSARQDGENTLTTGEVDFKRTGGKVSGTLVRCSTIMQSPVINWVQSDGL